MLHVTGNRQKVNIKTGIPVCARKSTSMHYYIILYFSFKRCYIIFVRTSILLLLRHSENIKKIVLSQIRSYGLLAR